MPNLIKKGGGFVFCNKCGRNVEDGMKFCDNCGNRLYSENEETLDNTAYRTADTKPKTNIMAIVGFILGCVSLLINFWGIIGIAALIFSIVGLTQIKNNGGGGKGLAAAGIILGAVGVIYGFVMIIAAGSLL